MTHPSQSPGALLTNGCADHFHRTLPPLLVQHLFLLRFNVCVVYTGLDLPTASLLQALSHLVCLLPLILGVGLDHKWHRRLADLVVQYTIPLSLG